MIQIKIALIQVEMIPVSDIRTPSGESYVQLSNPFIFLIKLMIFVERR